MTGSILSTVSKEFSYRRVLDLEDIPACRFDLWYAGTAEPVRRSSQSQRRKEKARVREDFWNAGSEIPRHCCDILLDQTRMRTRSLLLVPFPEIAELHGRLFLPLRYNSKVVKVFLRCSYSLQRITATRFPCSSTMECSPGAPICSSLWVQGLSIFVCSARVGRSHRRRSSPSQWRLVPGMVRTTLAGTAPGEARSRSLYEPGLCRCDGRCGCSRRRHRQDRGRSEQHRVRREPP